MLGGFQMYNVINNKVSTGERPFLGDDLEMQSSVCNLVDNFILSKISDKSVIGLNSSYGTGKSTFIKMSINYLKNHDEEKILPVYVNVSENEFTSSPLLNILHSIVKATGNNSLDYKNTIVKPLLNAGIKLATIGALDIDSIDKAFNVSAEKEVSNTAGNILNSFLGESDPKSELNKQLQKISKDNKIVIFLDDIDRCSPSFAIKILEELKFNFNSIDNMAFVIAYDREQLESFIQSKFGKHIDCDGYLRKFFDYTFLLPSVDKRLFLEKVAERCKESFTITKSVSKNLDEITHHIITNYELLVNSQSLRSLQQDFTRLSLGLAKHDIMVYDIDILCLLLFLRSMHWKLYSKLYRGQMKGFDLLEELKVDISFVQFFHTDSFAKIVAYDSRATNLEKSIKNTIRKLQFNEEKYFKALANNLNNLLPKGANDSDYAKITSSPNDLVEDIFKMLEYD